ncbi:MAG: ABC transporter permease [Catonella sp.]|nr:ABC transporter permease [Catonella sp.]MDY6355816.1 ABC transporter permease [Catonella sp.]
MENNETLTDLSQFGLTNEQLFAHIDNNDADSEKITAPRYSYWRSVFRVFFSRKLNIVMLCILGFILVFTYIYPVVTNYDPYANVMNASSKHLSPAQAIAKFGFSLHSCLGTGAAGQSTFDAMWYGAQISLSMSLICTLINMTIGVLLGAVWGYSKKFDIVMTEVLNIVGNVPTILLVQVLVLIFKPTFWTMVLAMCITDWMFVAYFIRTQVVIIRDREYNLASRCLGTPLGRIATRNILPVLTSVIVMYAAQIIPSYISYEVFLAYLGMGLSEMSLGKIINSAQNAMLTPGWGFEFWSPVALAAVLTITLYVVGQNLGDASDPRTHM